MKPSKTLRISAKADRDLQRLHFHINTNNPRAADALLESLFVKMKWIADVDFTGVPRDELSPGLRALPYKNRCIYFRSYPDRIVILRVLHGAQDVTAKTFEE
jgi:toxin ParE1/3/4